MGVVRHTNKQGLIDWLTDWLMWEHIEREHTESWLDGWLDRWTVEQLRKEKKRKDELSKLHSASDDSASLAPLAHPPVYCWVMSPAVSPAGWRFTRGGALQPPCTAHQFSAHTLHPPRFVSSLTSGHVSSHTSSSPAAAKPCSPARSPRSRHSSRYTVPNSRCKVHHWSCSCSCGDSNSKRAAAAAPRWSSSKMPYMQQRFSTVVCTRIVTAEGLYCFC